MRAIRRFLYRRGYRPHRESIFYSPSLAWLAAVGELTEAFGEGVSSDPTPSARPVAAPKRRPDVDLSHDWEWITETRGECNDCAACSDCDSSAFEPCTDREVGSHDA